MKIAVGVVNTPFVASLAHVARKADELGFESLWSGEHPFIPVDYATRYGGTPDGRIPPWYHQMLDPLVAIASAAAVTRNLRLATGICLVPERNPLFLAKEVASLDLISGGRFIFGVGAGWLKEEAEILGGDFSRRHARMAEYIRALQELWTKDEAEFHGKYIDFPAVFTEPKPVQKPYPPIHVGTRGVLGLKQVAQWGDGWCPLSPPPESTGEDMRRLRSLAEEAGRDPDRIEVSIYWMVDERTDFARVLGTWEEIGADRLVFMVCNDAAAGVGTYRFEALAPEKAEATLEWIAENTLARV
jgi:probable F420-dependent oxidoreductase